jgi:hypothetical protein
MYETDSQLKKTLVTVRLYVNTTQRYKWAAGTFFGRAQQRKKDKVTGEDYMPCGPLWVLLTKYC